MNTSEIIDVVDLMRDEFGRIRNLVDTDSEIAGLCNRAVTKIEQNVPVIVQRDKAESDLRILRTTLSEYLQLSSIDGVSKRQVLRKKLNELIRTQ